MLYVKFILPLNQLLTWFDSKFLLSSSPNYYSCKLQETKEILDTGLAETKVCLRHVDHIHCNCIVCKVGKFRMMQKTSKKIHIY